MKHFKNYTLERRQIHWYNCWLLAIRIIGLYRHLWRNNTLVRLVRHLRQYNENYVDLIWENQKLIGFGIYHIEKVRNHTVLFRSGAYIAALHRKQGLYGFMLESDYLHHQFQIDMVCVRTRRMAVVKAFYRFAKQSRAKRMYPNSFSEQSTELTKELLEVVRYFSKSKESYSVIVDIDYLAKKDVFIEPYFMLSKNKALMILVAY